MTARKLLRRYLRDDKGVSGVEFALIFPLTVLLLFGVFEVGQLLQVSRKATRVASTAADLISQANVITNQDRDDVFAAAAAIMTPFSVGTLTIVVSSITNNAGTISLAWSDGYHTTARSTPPASMPTGIVPPGASVIMTETSYRYTSPAGQFFTNGITMTDTFYARPRRSIAVGRTP